MELEQDHAGAREAPAFGENDVFMSIIKSFRAWPGERGGGAGERLPLPGHGFISTLPTPSCRFPSIIHKFQAGMVIKAPEFPQHCHRMGVDAPEP